MVLSCITRRSLRLAIDVIEWGLGRYCGEKRKFAVADYEAVDEYEWDCDFLIR